MTMEQISLFADKFILLNGATTAITALQTDDALEALKRYSDFYLCGRNVVKPDRQGSMLRATRG